MEEKEETSIKVCEYRSFTKNVTLGLATAFKRMGTFLRYIWPSLALSVVLPIPFYVFMKGRTDALMRKWNELGYIPEVKPKDLKGDVKRCTCRALVECLCDAAMVCLLAVAVYVAIVKGASLLVAFGIAALLFLLYIPFETVFMEISYSDKPVSKCFGKLKTGVKHYGKYFSLCMFRLLVGGVPVLFSCLPLAVAVSVSLQAYSAYLSGDVLDLPALFPLYVYLAYVVGMSVTLVTVSVFSFCRVLTWGSLVEEVPADTEVDGERI